MDTRATKPLTQQLFTATGSTRTTHFDITAGQCEQTLDVASIQGRVPGLNDLVRRSSNHCLVDHTGDAFCWAAMARSGDPVVKLLVGLILEDEQRHHSLLRSMVRRLQEEVEFVASASALPDLVLLDITMPRLIRA